MARLVLSKDKTWHDDVPDQASSSHTGKGAFPSHRWIGVFFFEFLKGGAIFLNWLSQAVLFDGEQKTRGIGALPSLKEEE
jgi:hypothetical protein